MPSKLFEGVPKALFDKGMTKMKEREHLWVATVVFEIQADVLASDAVVLNAEDIQAQNIQCIICSMEWRKGREKVMCSGTES